MKSQIGERISVSSAAKDSRDIVRRAEDLAATKEDLEQNTTDICNATTGVCDSESTENGGFPLLQYIDTIIDVPVSKTQTARGLHDEIQRNPDGQEAAFNMALDREQEAECLRQWSSERLAFQNSIQEREPRYTLCDIDYTSEDGCLQTKLTCQ